MLPLRARAMQHGDEVDSSANSNLQLPRPQLPLPQMNDPSPPPRPPQAKQIVPCRIFLRPDSSYLLISPFTQSLAGHIQNASNTFPKPRSQLFQLYAPHCTKVNTGVLAGPSTCPFEFGLSSPAHALLPPTPFGPNIAPLPHYAATPRPTATLRV